MLEAYALGSGAGWFRPHHLPQVESVELVSRFGAHARSVVRSWLPFSAVLWLPEGVHSRPSRDPGGAPPGGGPAAEGGRKPEIGGVGGFVGGVPRRSRVGRGGARRGGAKTPQDAMVAM